MASRHVPRTGFLRPSSFSVEDGEGGMRRPQTQRSAARRTEVRLPRLVSLLTLRLLDDVDRGAGLGKLGLYRLGLGLVDAFLDVGRGSLDQVLGFLQAQGRDFADSLDDVDLVRAEVLEDNCELGLLVLATTGSSGTATTG